MDWETRWLCWLEWTRPDQEASVWHSLWNGCKHPCRTTTLQLGWSCRKNPKLQKFFSWCCFLALWSHCILPSERVRIFYCYLLAHCHLPLSLSQKWIDIMQAMERGNLEVSFFVFHLGIYPMSYSLLRSFCSIQTLFLLNKWLWKDQ